MKWIACIFIALFSLNVFAEETFEHTVLRRLCVFPLSVPEELSSLSEQVWWELRLFLAQNHRFLVAEKSFLQQQNAYQPRAEMTPRGVIVVGGVVDSDAVMATYIQQRTLHMAVYETKYGRTLWHRQMELQPSLPLADQLASATLNLARDFIAAVPYQGFVIVDPMKDGPLYRDGKRLLFKADVGINSEAEVGDPAELIRVSTDRLDPIFTHSGAVEVFGQGRIVAVSNNIVTIDLSRVTKPSDVVEKSLVRLPKEHQRLEQQYSMKDPLRSHIDTEFLSPEITPTKESVAEHKPLVASLVFLFNLTAFLLLAF